MMPTLQGPAVVCGESGVVLFGVVVAGAADGGKAEVVAGGRRGPFAGPDRPVESARLVAAGRRCSRGHQNIAEDAASVGAPTRPAGAKGSNGLKARRARPLLLHLAVFFHADGASRRRKWRQAAWVATVVGGAKRRRPGHAHQIETHVTVACLAAGSPPPQLTIRVDATCTERARVEIDDRAAVFNASRHPASAHPARRAASVETRSSEVPEAHAVDGHECAWVAARIAAIKRSDTALARFRAEARIGRIQHVVRGVVVARLLPDVLDATVV